MARRYDSKELREIVAALDDSDVPVKEIGRRLRAGEAGLRCGSIPISNRRIYELRRDHREDPERQPDEDVTVQSIAALEDRIVKLLAREVAAKERKRPGQLTAEDSRILDAHHKALISVRNRSRGRSKPSGNGKPDGGEQEMSAMERLAAEEAAPASGGVDDGDRPQTEQ